MRRRWQKLGIDQQPLFPDGFQSSYYQAPKPRHADYLIAEIYCPNEDCAVRSCECLIKLLGPSFPKQPDDDLWKCPGCGGPAKFMGAFEPAEYRRLYGEFRDITQPEEGDG
jgi:hypothetical protein